MFKEFEQYLADYEDSLRNAYLNASKAHKDWANAYHNKDIDITTTSFYDRRKYGSICYAKVTKYAREDVLILNGSKYYVVVDYREIDGTLYEEVVNIVMEEEKDGAIHYLYICGRTARMIEAKYDGYHKFLFDREVLEQDVKLTMGRTDEWIVERAHKDMLAHKKWIESKVEKMLGKVEEVAKVSGDGWYLHGSNGKVGHMWFVEAGGYAVQRFHYRCLLKEVKNK